MKKPPPKAIRQNSIGPVILTAKGMHTFLGLKSVWFHKLVKDGVLPKVGTGAYDPMDVTQAYIEHIKDGATRQAASSSLDDLRDLKAREIKLNMAKKDRELISMDEALAVIEEITGQFASYLSGLPAEITGVVRERQRIDAIIDEGKQRLFDRFEETASAFASSGKASEAEAEDDAN
ncbi:hypothetical protein [Roseibium sp.]|uniref:hypothetical protein n=1 Tax=Roseibium sp. TaxID=1936156 RepID=UPI003BA85CC4